MTTPLEVQLMQTGAAPAPGRGLGLLHVPLALKVVGANLFIALMAWGAVFSQRAENADGTRMLTVLTIALVAGIAVNVALVIVALKPIRDLEDAVRRMWHGDASARVPLSPIGDRTLDRVSGTVNALLDHLAQDRARMHGLASEIIRAEDSERARIGRELHESIAQSLAAVSYQLTAAEHDVADPIVAARIRTIRVLAGQVLDEVDMLSHSVHPRVLNDLGLLPGLRHLARTVSDDTHAIDVHVTAGRDSDFRGLGVETAAVLYRVAQEAIQNAMRHANARHIEINVASGAGAVTLQVKDDGPGFNLDEASRRRPGMGLFTMRERVGLVRGEFGVDTSPGHGTSVRVKIPVAHDTFKPAEAV